MTKQEIEKEIEACESCRSIKDTNVYAGLNGCVVGYCCESLLIIIYQSQQENATLKAEVGELKTIISSLTLTKEDLGKITLQAENERLREAVDKTILALRVAENALTDWDAVSNVDKKRTRQIVRQALAEGEKEGG